MTWQTSNSIPWYQKLYWAIWNSIIALWDDNVVTWDAVGDHDWNTQNAAVTWFTKN